MKITVLKKNNGYLVTVEGVHKDNGEWIFKSNEDLKLVEFVGGLIVESKIKAEIQ